MDFDPIPGLWVEGYRLSPITMIEPGHKPSGDAYLVCPDGSLTNLHWQSGAPTTDAYWDPPPRPAGPGVIQVRVQEAIAHEQDLASVLRIATMLAAGNQHPGR